MGEKRPGLNSLQSNYLQQRLNTAQDQRVSIPRRSHGEEGVVSFGQERIWFLERLEPETVIYHRPLHLSLRGALNVEAFEQGLQTIVRRHAPLHTTFEMVGDGLSASVQSDPIFHLRQHDLSDLDDAEKPAYIEATAQAELMRPFDLTKDLMARGLLLRLAPDEHLLLCTFHHIASDGWSDNVLLRELGILYSAFVEGRPALLPALPIQYADFAAWQRAEMQGERLERHLAYWRGCLADFTPLDLPTDRPRPSVQRYRSAVHCFSLSSELAANLRALSQQEGVTIYMTLLATFQVLLYRYTSQEDIAVGTPIAGRTRSEVEGLIGLFINTLAMRSDLSGNPTFRSLLQQVRRTALEGYDHQDLPFEKLVDALRPERYLNRHPLFDVMFQLANPAAESFQWPDLAVQRRSATAPAIGFDLSLTLREQGNGLNGVVLYDRDLFDAGTIERMMIHYQTLLMGIAADPDGQIALLPLLSHAERHQILIEWNNSDVPAQERCIHHRFEAQAERTPEAIALIAGTEQLTYVELNACANQLAHYLQTLGIGPGMLVGICIERSGEMIVGVLAILKAGAAYLPLDPTYPQDRLAFMIADSNPAVLLTMEHLRSQLPPTGAQILRVDSVRTVVAAQPDHNPLGAVQTQDLIYILYTSGSTGRPKGAMLTHQNVGNFLDGFQKRYPYLPADRVLQLTSLGFDISALEIFGAWSAGATLVLAPQHANHNPDRLIQTLQQQSITVIQVVPSLLQILLQQPEFKECQSLHTVLCGGEVLPLTLQQRFLETLSAKLVNLYGPTESAIYVTGWTCRADDQFSTVPIGRPFANVEIYILDAHMQPVPIGVAGELHVGGCQVGPGYLHRLDLTAERFVDNPFGPGQLYKTGDLARYRPDGEIEFLGRMDHQMKIRGFRIEPGEIEACLAAHPSVVACAVNVSEDGAGDKRLVAYVVATDPKVDLRSYAQSQLPDYMIPHLFVLLETLPLSPNGKVDRKALPAPAPSYLNQVSYVAPRTPIEEWMVTAWADLLQRERVSVHDDFFELGGHSLLIIQFLGRLSQIYGVDLPIRTFFTSPTVAQLASVVIQKQLEGIGVEDLEQLLSRVEIGSTNEQI
ncbi:MAG: amino acid adenylation domain-containing protein [Caldilineaceae bacterium]|nr:amino acid adenylation domain-containing protein [Caldilineaceae bacterium]